MYVGEHGGKFAHLTEGNTDIDEVRSVWAGKFRRYHGESWLRRVLDIKTNVMNLRDLFLFGMGTLQSLLLLPRLKPDVVLLKGGYVGVPVGLAAALWRRPFVTHDSDALPGLANRIVSSWATYHATGMPAEMYSYPAETTRYIGVLVGRQYRLVTPERQAAFKQALSMSPDDPLLLITGGSLGAQRLNEAIRALMPHLLADFPRLRIVHQVGQGQTGVYDGFTDPRLAVLEFLQPMARYTGAADVVVTRAGANTLAELAVQGKACVVVPNPLLSGGHQLKNAEGYVHEQAILAVDETAFKTSTDALDAAIRELLGNPGKRQELGQRFHALSTPDAAQKLAMVLLEVGKPTTKPTKKQKS